MRRWGWSARGFVDAPSHLSGPAPGWRRGLCAPGAAPVWRMRLAGGRAVNRRQPSPSPAPAPMLSGDSTSTARTQLVKQLAMP